ANGVVVLLDSAGVQRGGAFSDAGGAFAIRAPSPGRFRLRAERLGYDGAVTPFFDVAVGATVRQRIELAPKPFVVPQVVARATTSCAPLAGQGQVVIDLWTRI